MYFQVNTLLFSLFLTKEPWKKKTYFQLSVFPDILWLRSFLFFRHLHESLIYSEEIFFFLFQLFCMIFTYYYCNDYIFTTWSISPCVCCTYCLFLLNVVYSHTLVLVICLLFSRVSVPK